MNCLIEKLDHQYTPTMYNTITYTLNVVSFELHGPIVSPTKKATRQHSNLHTYNAHGKKLNA